LEDRALKDRDLRPLAARLRDVVGRLRVPALAAAGTLLFSCASFAQGEPKGMPQLDFRNPLTIAQVVWMAIIFLALYLLVGKWALPQVSAVLETRAATISADLDAARAAKAEADAAVAELTTATRQAQTAAQAEIASAVAAAKADADKLAVIANARLDAQLADAERQIDAARRSALGALREVASETAGMIVRRLTGIEADQTAIEQAVGPLLAARSQA
jgi:F-type H+-transporting ATPase subunit b